ncbi:MAG: cation:proton antiporter [Duodenibacillus sp.]|nr:cation:proton antiporter [Duodenibacillus sp.]
MSHSLPLISTLALAFGLALIFGYIAERLKTPALVGYLLAGIMVGPYTTGPVADVGLAHQLSELGVMLLMFGVGLHFSLQDLMRVKNIAISGAVLQMSIATLLGTLFAHGVWDWPWAESIVFGLCLSCASTVVLLKALELRGQLSTIDGQIAVGWLVVEDIATVLILVLLPPFALLMSADTNGQALSAYEMGKIILFTILRVVAFVVLMMVLGRKLIPKALMMVANTGSRELFTLFLLACSIGIAFGAAAVFEVSFALGAFFAGMVMRESKYAHRAATESLPLQDAFAVLFFVGVGMMLDWHVLFEQPISVLCVLAIIMLGKSVTAFALVHCLKYPLHTSLIVGASLAQIGEFSFILAAQGIALKLMDEQIMSMIVAAAILSIALNPVMFALIPPLRRYLLRWFRWARTAAMRTDPFSVLPKETERRVLMGQAIIVGTGTVCGKIRDKFVESQMPFVSVVEDQTQAAQMRERKLAVITGDASDPMVLVQSHIVTAKMLLIIGLDQIKAKKVVEVARQLNPNIRILVRMRSRIEMQHWGETQDIEFLYDRDMISESMFKSIQAHYQPADAAH